MGVGSAMGRVSRGIDMSVNSMPTRLEPYFGSARRMKSGNATRKHTPNAECIAIQCNYSRAACISGLFATNYCASDTSVMGYQRLMARLYAQLEEGKLELSQLILQRSALICSFGR